MFSYSATVSLPPGAAKVDPPGGQLIDFNILRRWGQIAVAGLLFVVVGVLTWKVLAKPEPVYQGRRLRQYLDQMAKDSPRAMLLIDEIYRDATYGTAPVPASFAQRKFVSKFARQRWCNQQVF